MTVMCRTWAGGQAWAYDFHRGGVRYTRSGFRNRKEATDAEASHKTRLMDSRLAREYGIQPPRGRVLTVRQFIHQEWLPERKATLGPRTYQNALFYGRRLSEAFGPYRLTDLTLRHGEQWRDECAAKFKPNQVRELAKWARILMRAAIRRGYIGADPFQGIRLPRQEATKVKILRPEEERRILAEIRVPSIRSMIQLILLTGLRRQEACGLTWADVDLRQRVVRLIQPKTQALKVLPLIPEAVTLLASLPRRIGPIFTSPKGRRTPHAVQQTFRRAAQRAGVDISRLQDLRHTVAVRLLESGVDIPTVGMILGHRPPYRTTMLYIAHTTRVRAELAMASLSKTHSKTQAESS